MTLTKMRWFGRLLPVNQNKNQNPRRGCQNGADQN
jgi:hypothetical protein